MKLVIVEYLNNQTYNQSLVLWLEKICVKKFEKFIKNVNKYVGDIFMSLNIIINIIIL
jgi:hypothetical protein